MSGFLRFLTIALIIVVGSGIHADGRSLVPAAKAQSSGSGTSGGDMATRAIEPQEGASPSQEILCSQAVRTLAETDGKDDAAFAMFNSDACQRIRDAYAFDVTPEIEQISQALRNQGIDYDADFAARQKQCLATVDRQMALPVPEGKPTPIREELIERCNANTRTALYSEGIVALNKVKREWAAAEKARINEEDRRKRAEYDAAKAEYEAGLIARENAIAEQERAYQEGLAEWRRRVELCKKGKSKYCADPK